MSDNSDPCKVCGGPVRVRHIPTPTLADANAVFDQRVCLNPDCETNERDRSLGTPTP
jgi:hypothetical protein